MDLGNRLFESGELKKWKSVLGEVAEELTIISKSTESEFLTLGESLNHFFDINSNNALQVKGVVEKIDSGEKLNISGMSAQFSKAYSELEVLKQTFSKVTDSFSTLREKVNKILEMKEFLSSISYSIKMLSILMKIKSSKLKGDLFSQEIKSIDTLAKGIAQNTKEITDFSTEILEFIDISLKNISDSIKEFDVTLLSSNEKLGESIEHLSNDTEKTKETCLKIKYLSDQIFPEINNIVSGIQFHDIARQKMEHICEALQTLSEASNDAEDEEVTFRKLAIILRLQIAHIQNVKSEAKENSGHITDYLQGISKIAIEQGINANVVQNIAGKSSTRMNIIGEQLQQLPMIFKIISSIKDELLKAVDVIDLNITKVAKQLKNIESFQTDLKLLTINSVILASQLDKSGKVMSVIADNIKNLSNVVKTEVEIKEALIKDIVDISEHYKGQLKSDLEEKTSNVEVIFNATTDVINTLVKDDELVFELSKTTKTFEHEVSQISLNLNFEEIVTTQLEDASQKLSRILEKIDAVYSPTDELSEQVQEELNILEEQYTMQSERDIHQSSLGENNSSQESQGEDEIELFDNFDTDANSDVELFDTDANSGVELFDTDTNSGVELFDTDTNSGVELFDTDTNSGVELFDTDTNSGVELFDTDTNSGVELFDTDTNSENTDKSPDHNTTEKIDEGKEEDLGDNIELF